MWGVEEEEGIGRPKEKIEGVTSLLPSSVSQSYSLLSLFLLCSVLFKS
jgi:hypothetical protein